MYNQLDIRDIYRLIYSITAKNTFVSGSHGTFTRVDHILGHRVTLTNLKE